LQSFSFPLSLAVLSVGVSTSRRFSCPFNGDPRASPTMRRAVHSRLGSALRFSQPLSGFLADPSFAALFRAATVPGIPPSECSPRKDRAPLSRPPCIPCRYQPSCVSVPPASLLPLVSPTPTPSRSCLDPHSGYRFPFHEPKSTSRLPWATSDGTTTFRQLHRLRSLDPSASPFLTKPGCPDLAADPLLGFFPSRAFSNRTLGPRPAQVTRT
jgi:hypothetical protein